MGIAQNITTIAGTGTANYNGDGIAATSADINSALGIILDGNGNVYFGDKSNQRVRKITVSTGLISTIAGTGTLGYNGDGSHPVRLQGMGSIRSRAVSAPLATSVFTRSARRRSGRADRSPQCRSCGLAASIALSLR